jgi:hypothetical protein
MNYAAIAEELKRCPGDCLGLFLWAPSQEAYEFFVAFRSDCNMRLADALSQAIEFCERMAAIGTCQLIALYGSHELMPSSIREHEPTRCQCCPAEYHRCDDGVWRWL